MRRICVFFLSLYQYLISPLYTPCCRFTPTYSSQVVGASFTSLSGLLGGRRLIPKNISSSLAEEGWLPFPGEGGAGLVRVVYIRAG